MGSQPTGIPDMGDAPGWRVSVAVGFSLVGHDFPGTYTCEAVRLVPLPDWPTRSSMAQVCSAALRFTALASPRVVRTID